MMELTRALEVISLVKGLVRPVPFQEEIYRRWIALRHRLQTGYEVLQSFVMNRFNNCRQRTTLLAITSEKDTMCTIVSVSL